MTVIPDSFDFARYVADVRSRSDVLKTESLDLVDAFYGERAKGDSTPWPKVGSDLEFRQGEVTLWPGISGHGKTLVTTQCAFHLAALGKRVAIVSLEMTPVSTMARMARMVSGTSKPTPDWLNGFKAWANDKIFLMSVQGMAEPTRVLDFCRYVHKAAGVSHVFIDNLTKCLRDEEDHAASKAFVDALCTLARDTKMHVHLVAHTRKTESELKVPDKFDTRGSSSIIDQVDNVIAVWRNKPKESEMAMQKDPAKLAELADKPDTILNVCKQRHGDWEGKVGLYLHKESMWFLERPRQPHPLPQLFTVKPSVPEVVPF